MPRTRADLAADQVAPADVDHRQRAADGRAVGQADAGRRGGRRQLAERMDERPLVRQHDAHPPPDGPARAVEAGLAGLQVDREGFQQQIGLHLGGELARRSWRACPARLAEVGCVARPGFVCASAAGSMPPATITAPDESAAPVKTNSRP